MHRTEVCRIGATVSAKLYEPSRVRIWIVPETGDAGQCANLFTAILHHADDNHCRDRNCNHWFDSANGRATDGLDEFGLHIEGHAYWRYTVRSNRLAAIPSHTTRFILAI